MPNDQKKNPSANSGGIDLSARRNARSYVLQALYQLQLANPPIAELEAEFLRHQIDKKIDLDYFKELVRGIPAMQAELDATFSPYLGRLLEEIDPIELSVLRLATYELLKRPDVPYRVVINEALELTKKFGSVEGFKFVNGVLDRVAKKTRAVEIGAAKKE